jgi:hypothetical protein
MFPFTGVVAEWRIALSLISDQERSSGDALLELKNTLEDACRAIASHTRWPTSNS